MYKANNRISTPYYIQGLQFGAYIVYICVGCATFNHVKVHSFFFFFFNDCAVENSATFTTFYFACVNVALFSVM